MKEQSFHKCNFCQATHSPRFSNGSPYFKICLPKAALDDIEFADYEFVCDNNYNHFMLDGYKVVETAKELNISVRDMLELISAASK